MRRQREDKVAAHSQSHDGGVVDREGYEFWWRTPEWQVRTRLEWGD